MEHMNIHMKNRSSTLATAIHSCLVPSSCSLLLRSCINAFICTRISSSTKLRLSSRCCAILSSVVEKLFFIPPPPPFPPLLLFMWLCRRLPLWLDLRWCADVGLSLFGCPCRVSIEGFLLLFNMTEVIEVSMELSPVGVRPREHELRPYRSEIEFIQSIRARISNTTFLTNRGTCRVPMWWTCSTTTVEIIDAVVIARNVARYIPVIINQVDKTCNNKSRYIKPEITNPGIYSTCNNKPR